MRVVAKVLGLSFLIFFQGIFGAAGKAQRQETTTNKAGEALYRQRCAA